MVKITGGGRTFFQKTRFFEHAILGAILGGATSSEGYTSLEGFDRRGVLILGGYIDLGGCTSFGQGVN